MVMSDNLEMITPKLSSCLVFHPIEKEFLLHQKKYGYRIKVSSQTYNLLNLINGTRNLNEISNLYKKKYTTDLPPKVIHNILFKKLAKYGIIESEVKVSHISKPSYLKLSFTIVNKDILSKITPYFSFLFSKQYTFPVLIFCMSIIPFILSYSYSEFIESMSSLSIERGVLIFVISIISVVFHELGHASATKKFGAEHGSIGCGFYLLTPVFFADVSDIWKLKPHQRIMVNLAGIYFEMIFCCLVLLAAYIFGNQSLLIATLVILFRTLYNLNPLIRNDGYWVLSDLASIPNLKDRSNKEFLKLFYSIFSKKNGRFDFSTKNAMLVTYSIVSNSFIILFIVFLLMNDPYSIASFPRDLYHFVLTRSNLGESKLMIKNIQSLLIPFIFYYLLLNFIFGMLKNCSAIKHYASNLLFFRKIDRTPSK